MQLSITFEENNELKEIKEEKIISNLISEEDLELNLEKEKNSIELIKEIKKLITPKEYEVLKYRQELISNVENTKILALEKIAKIISKKRKKPYSRERIRQIEKGALEKLRTPKILSLLKRNY